MKYTKDPDAVLDYLVDWSAWLPTGDTITASTFTVNSEDDGAIVVDDTLFDSTTTTVWLSGGVAGEKYTVTNHITTADGREDDRSITISIKEL